MSDHPNQRNHPYPTGALIRHINQQFPPYDIYTAVVREAKGPFHDGTYEYLVVAGREFARHLGPDNPLERQAQWSSNAVRLIDDGTQTESTEE